MKKLLFSLSLLFVSVVSTATPRSLSQMMTAAEGVLKSGPAATRSGSLGLEVMRQGVQYTVLGYKTGGFAVIANDDMFNAVLGYSDTEFTPDNMPPALLWWMDAADAAMSHRLANGQTSTATVIPSDNGYPAAVEELMLSRWDQGVPYNNIVSQKLRADVYTGCVATAMAQVMYFHKSPTQGSGSKSYRIVSDDPATNEQLLRVSFSATTYDWDNMLPTYTLGSYNEAQADAVATLMLHCGVAVNMSYGTSTVGGSGAHDYEVATSAKQYFHYSTKFYTRDIYPTTQWMDIIYNEISNGYPILYGGVTANMAGHAFVFDGYDANGLVHVNWGWSGSGNGYFDVGLLNSDQGSYSYSQDMVIMHPEGQPELPYSSQWGLLYWPLQNIKGSFTVTASGKQLAYQATDLYQMDAELFTGQLGLLAAPINGGAPIVLDARTVTPPTGGSIEYLSGYSRYGNSVSTASLPDGTYRVYMVSKATEETSWQPVHSSEAILNNYILTISNGMASVTKGDPGWTTGIQGVEVTGTRGDGMVRVYTVDGVLVYSAPADGFNISDVPAKGLLIVKKGQEVTKVMK